MAGQAQVQKEATVQGQLEKLSAQAKDGQIPSYATASSKVSHECYGGSWIRC